MKAPGTISGRRPGFFPWFSRRLRLWIPAAITAVSPPLSHAGAPGPGLKIPEAGAFALDLARKAGSPAKADLAAVRAALGTRDGLLKLNSAEEYTRLGAEDLALHAVLGKLAGNPSEEARKIISDLCGNRVFLGEEARAESLLLTLPKVKPLPNAAVPFLRRSLDPEGSRSEIAVWVLFESGDKAAMKVFAQEVLAGRQDPILVISWMRDALLRHRRDAPVLEMSLGLLENPKLDAGLKNALVEALFDYRPVEWYSQVARPPKPPASGNATAEARELLKRIKAAVAGDARISVKNKALAAKGGA